MDFDTDTLTQIEPDSGKKQIDLGTFEVSIFSPICKLEELDPKEQELIAKSFIKELLILNGTGELSLDFEIVSIKPGSLKITYKVNENFTLEVGIPSYFVLLAILANPFISDTGYVLPTVDLGNTNYISSFLIEEKDKLHKWCDERGLELCAELTSSDIRIGHIDRVKKGDTLSGIVNELELGDWTEAQVMLAIFNDNPKAFNGSIHKLIKGSQVKLPTPSSINKTSHEEAIRILKSHGK